MIGRGLFDRPTGLVAAFLYSVFQPWWEFRDLALNGELLMNLPPVWAWAIALRRSSSRLRPELFLAGPLLGDSVLRFNGEPFSFGRANPPAKSATLDALAAGCLHGLF